MSEKEKMLAGQLYNHYDKQLTIERKEIAEKMCQQHGENRGAAGDDRAGNAGCVCQADIVENILQECLHKGQCQHDGRRISRGKRQFFVEQQGDEQGHYPGAQKAIAGIDELGESATFLNGEQFVADFNAGECAAPEQRADDGAENNIALFCEECLQARIFLHGGFLSVFENFRWEYYSIFSSNLLLSIANIPCFGICVKRDCKRLVSMV